MIRTLGSSFLVLVVAAGCAAVDDDATPPVDGFTLIQHDATTLEARVVDGGGRLDVLITETEPGVVDATFDFGDPVIAFSLDYNQGVGEFMPAGGVLDAAHSRLVDLWLAGVSEAIEPDASKQTRVEFVAVRQGSFMQIVPPGEALAQGQFKSERGWTHIGCSCARKYIGGGYYRTCGKGCGCTGGSGRGCKGRCGQGCGGTSSPRCYGSTAYTRDCARHDWGVGSWWAASDDFSFASNNCSCGGNCY